MIAIKNLVFIILQMGKHILSFFYDEKKILKYFETAEFFSI